MNSKEKTLLHKCRVEIYKTAYPSSDYDWLVEMSKNPFFTEAELQLNFSYMNFWLPREIASQIVLSIAGKKNFNKFIDSLYMTDMPTALRNQWKKKMAEHIRDNTWFYQTFKDQIEKIYLSVEWFQ
jgi:hypothetical protein